MAGERSAQCFGIISPMQKRIKFLDWMRVAACFMVMAIHACEPYYLGGEAPDITHVASRADAIWITLTECLCRVCVPLFAMASAYLLFPLKTTTGAFFRRRFVRILVPFSLWAIAYVAAAGENPAHLLFNFPDAGGHLWFVPMLAGLYIAMPLLSPWAEKVGERELRGWIFLWLLTTTLPFLRLLWGRLFGEPSFGAVPYLWGECPWNAFGAFHYVSGFIGYMLLGLWFRKFAPEISWRRTLAVAAPLWIAGAAALGLPFFLRIPAFPWSAPYAAAVTLETSIEYCSTGVALATIAAFMVFRKFDFGGAFYDRVVRPVSEASYGMYLMHMFILAPVSAALIPRLPTPAAIIATAAASFAASAIAAMAIRRVPVVGKWICG